MNTDQVIVAGMARRLGAMFYDGLLLIAISMGGTGAAIALRVAFSSAQAAADDPNTAVHGPLYQLFIIVLLTSFYVYFWRRDGQTLGMQAWRIRVQNQDGSLLSTQQCLQRLGAGLLSWLCLGLGFLQAFVRKDKLTWTDQFSKSVVVHLPKKK